MKKIGTLQKKRVFGFCGSGFEKSGISQGNGLLVGSRKPEAGPISVNRYYSAAALLRGRQVILVVIVNTYEVLVHA